MEEYTLFLLDGLNPEEQSRCREQAFSAPRRFAKGETIYDSALARRALALVLEGQVRVLHGRVVMNDLGPGDVFGAAALFGGEEPYPSQVVAVTRCRIVFIEQEQVSALMAAYPRVGENYVRFLSDRIRFLNTRLSALTAGQTDDRLWRFLLTHRDERGAVRLPGGMTELAEALGMGRTSLYRSLEQLTAAGKIRRQGKEIMVMEETEK